MDEAALDGLLGDAQAAFPGITAVARAALGARLRELGGPGVRAAEVYLAMGCAAGDPVALAHLERTQIAPLARLLGRVARDGSVVDEVLQRVRVRVLVPEGGAPARIAGYEGRGSLLGWLKVVALRLHATYHQDQRPAAEESVEEAAPSALRPDQLLLDARLGPVVRDAIARALRGLPPRDRALLRLCYLDGLPLDKIGGLYGVHKATVSRWIASARQALLERTLSEAQGVAGTPEELVSACRRLVSRIDLSVSAWSAELVDDGMP